MSRASAAKQGETTSLVKPRLLKAAQGLRHLPRAAALVWSAAPGWTICWSVGLAVQGILPAVLVYLIRSLVNAITGVGGGKPEWQPILSLVAAIAAVELFSEALRGFGAYCRTAMSEILTDHISSLVHKKSVSVDLAFYDSADFYDHLHRARSQAADRPAELVDTAGSLVQNAITVAALAAILVPFGLWLPGVLLLGASPALYVVLRHGLVYQDWWRRTTRQWRRAWYYEWLATTGEVAAELRLFGLGDRFCASYKAVKAPLRAERLKLARWHSAAQFGASTFGLAATGAALGWTVWRTARGLATLGDLAMLYQTFNQGLRIMREMFSNTGRLYASLLFVGNLFEFLDLKPGVTDPPQPRPVPHPPASGIRFENVTFRYAAGSPAAVENFSLFIPAGQVVAILGSNGAGKSTLLKLLCRFYDPEAGCVTIDGKDLREFAVSELREKISVLFQQPVHYSDTLRQNIAYGIFPRPESPASLKSAAEAAGADGIVARLPEGYETMLGRMFAEGAELSGGEWQRIALARAFIRCAPILLLDEPTSAMDPWAETDWLTRFRELSAGRTVLIITHRLRTAMFADTIHVISNGRIVESGRHESLAAGNGPYAKAWSAQCGR